MCFSVFLYLFVSICVYLCVSFFFSPVSLFFTRCLAFSLTFSFFAVWWSFFVGRWLHFPLVVDVCLFVAGFRCVLLLRVFVSLVLLVSPVPRSPPTRCFVGMSSLFTLFSFYHCLCQVSASPPNVLPLALPLPLPLALLPALALALALELKLELAPSRAEGVCEPCW